MNFLFVVLQVKFSMGDVICFGMPQITDQKYSCSWNSSNENALSINPQSGFAVAKSKQNGIIVSYQCSNNLQIVTAVDVYGLQKVRSQFIFMRLNITFIFWHEQVLWLGLFPKICQSHEMKTFTQHFPLCLVAIDLIVGRPFIAHLNLYTRLKPTCDKKIGIMELVYIFNQWAFKCRTRGPWFKPRWPLGF